MDRFELSVSGLLRINGVKVNNSYEASALTKLSYIAVCHLSFLGLFGTLNKYIPKLVKK